MSATATSVTFDQDSIEEIMIRWTLAQEYLGELNMSSLPGENALRVLVRQDVPSLLNEIMRLRPYLA